MKSRKSEGEKFAEILSKITSYNFSIVTLTLLIRELSQVIAFKSAMYEILSMKKIDNLKKPRSVDEFLAILEKEAEEKNG